MLSPEVIYGGSRVEIGGGRIRGDGSIGAWAARWVRDYGVVPRPARFTRSEPLRREPLPRLPAAAACPTTWKSWRRSTPFAASSTSARGRNAARDP